MPRRSDLFYYGTKSSKNWSCVPGNFDSCNTNYIFESDNVYGIPKMLKQDFDVVGLIEYGTAVKRGLKYAKDKTIHFFLDDYRFEPMWNKPYKYLGVMQRHGKALSPDFSVYYDTPLVVQMYNVYRNRWLGRFWQEFGVKVIPTITWGDERSYDFVFSGVEKGSPVAISVVSLRRVGMKEHFLKGFYEMIQRIEPAKLVVYGDIIPIDFKKYVDEVCIFDSYWSAKKKEVVKNGEGE